MPRNSDGPRVGIEKIWAFPGTLYLDFEELARARGYDEVDVRENLMVITRSLNPLWEDPVTNAVNAALPMLTDEDRAQIELLVVATESSVDQGKSISAFAHSHLGLKDNCRCFELKQACYGGTASVMMAANWVASGFNPGKKALVIATDQSRNSIGEPYEYVMGAGAVAMIIGDAPRVVELCVEHCGYWTRDVLDTFRPTSRVETGNGETSLYCYIDALEGSYAHFLSKVGCEVDFDTYFKKNIYHVPFGGITFQAHRTLLRQWKRMKKSEAIAHFNKKSKPGLIYNSLLGGTYSGSTFLALMGMIDTCDDLLPGDRIGIFSYGSGSSGEYYDAVVCPEAREVVARADLQGLLDARTRVSVERYEKLENDRFALIDVGDQTPDTTEHGDLYQRRYVGQRLLTFKGIKEYYREYGFAE